MEDLIEALEDYMVRNHLKRYELANKLGTTPVNITNWLNGKHKISPAWKRLIQKQLDLKAT